MQDIIVQKKEKKEEEETNISQPDLAHVTLAYCCSKSKRHA